MSLREARTSLWIVALTALVVGVSALFAFRWIPLVIADAYRGESIGLLNWAIEGQSIHPVEYYLDEWRGIATGGLVFVAGVGLLLAMLCLPPVQRAIDARVGPLPRGESPQARWQIGTGRLLLASAVIACLVGAQLFDIALQAEHWPFSRYSMYSAEQESSFTWVQLYGVTPEGEQFLDPRTYFHPFDESRLPIALEGHIVNGADAPAKTRTALENLYDLYERGRISGWHAGPKLTALRMYHVRWQIERGAANKERPEEKILLDELPTA